MRLQTKVLCVLASLTLAAGLLVRLFSGQAVDAVLVAGLAQRALAHLGEISPKAGAALRARDETALLPLLIAAKAQLPARYAMALDPSGVVLAHTNVVEKGKTYRDPAALRIRDLTRPDYQVADVAGEKVLDLALPVWASEDFLLSQEHGQTRLGTLRLGLPLQPVFNARSRILGRITLILLLTLGATVALLLLLLRDILAPLRLLAESARKIGRGLQGVTVPVTSEDELGDLAESFNRMSLDLAATTVSKDYLDGVVRSIVDILVVTDPEGRIQTINDAALKALGYSEKELLGRPVLPLIAGPDAGPRGTAHGPPPFAGSRLEVLGGKGPVNAVEMNLLGRSGEKIPVLLSGSALTDSAGRLGGFVIVAKDLSEHKRLEALLLQAEKMSAVGRLAAGIAHEINNPLGVILGFSQTALAGVPAGGDLALPLQTIIQEAHRCKDLVQNLLVFSRTQNAEAREEVDLNAALKAALPLIQALAKLRRVELVEELAAGLPRLSANGMQLQQVLINLATNGIDAMPEGGRLTIRSAPSRSRPGHLEITIQDTGRGIPPEIQSHIFEPFFTTKEVGQGTGLGLALVYEIVTAHRGAVEFQSAPERGTTFTVRLPLG